MSALNVMNLSISTSCRVSHIFGYVVYVFSFNFRNSFRPPSLPPPPLSFFLSFSFFFLNFCLGLFYFTTRDVQFVSFLLSALFLISRFNLWCSDRIQVGFCCCCCMWWDMFNFWVCGQFGRKFHEVIRINYNFLFV